MRCLNVLNFPRINQLQTFMAEPPVVALVLLHPLPRVRLVVRRRDDHPVADNLVVRPVGWHGHVLPIAYLQCPEQPEYLVHVPADRERVVDHRPHGTFGVDDEDCPNRLRTLRLRV